MEDSYKHKGLRRKLVESLRRKGIQDERVLSAMEVLPRHFFLDDAFAEWAYTDKPFQIGKGQTISQPFTVAYQTELLEVKKREKILEIGTGSGYQAAILAIMGARVFTVERHAQLHENAKKLLRHLKLGNIRCFHRDGFNGLPEFAPYAKILVTAGAAEVPQALLDQLEVGGMLVIPVGKKVQTMYRITRKGADDFQTEKFNTFRFVPFLKGLD
ncbi:protein-L-isoaspartate(D-aspartate) O-methyltransferase [Flavilitoribacter nigricans]|uniref:Protein-L-isoaspartate O-methyltransferase n=1 Tax=Flavilitoribacter nigricans (strain ATCC 23147 / DSM 23189 / NBRC 102662 / NCIMB 1420 / SS-2) TaxID=1122177 RepID=A0A2D0NHG5_FLAN2|nr:protein-L-isoaspartate(D-aspartate) O-methyltransferase [Flavilitoribacter nigricans]PHN07213.1 protein-L-isoaspartate O-methyltransferase [Flavilitoribacter nigricans DSM 23189 = NBRC 102662]